MAGRFPSPHLTGWTERTYIECMKSLWVIVPLFALLFAAFFFLGETWTRLSGSVPLYGWFAIIGGVVFSLALGGGLMALMFYSARRGYDDSADGRPE
jgi:hypothetical protein